MPRRGLISSPTLTCKVQDVRTRRAHRSWRCRHERLRFAHAAARPRTERCCSPCGSRAFTSAAPRDACRSSRQKGNRDCWKAKPRTGRGGHRHRRRSKSGAEPLRRGAARPRRIA
jgi:hypothetical protein